jgi:hypothetical protein
MFFEECLYGRSVLRKTEPCLPHAQQDRFIFDGCHNREEAYALLGEPFEIDWLLHLHRILADKNKPSIPKPATNWFNHLPHYSTRPNRKISTN